MISRVIRRVANFPDGFLTHKCEGVTKCEKNLQEIKLKLTIDNQFMFVHCCCSFSDLRTNLKLFDFEVLDRQILVISKPAVWAERP